MIKRFLAAALCGITLFSAASCGKSPIPETTHEPVSTTAEDLSRFTGAELYERAASLRAELGSDRFESEITLTLKNGEEVLYTKKTSARTCREHIGFQDFAFSRTQTEKVGEEEEVRSAIYYRFGTASVSSPAGNFTAPTTLTAFESFLKDQVPPEWYYDISLFGEVQNNGTSVSYSAPSEEAKALFSAYYAPVTAEAQVLQLSGSAHLNRRGVIDEESVVLSGTAQFDGALCEMLLTVKTTLRYYNDAAISAEVPEGEFLHINDIRIPTVFQNGVDALRAASEFNANLTDSTSVRTADSQTDLFSTGHINVIRSEGKVGFNIQRQDMLREAGETAQNTLFQLYAGIGEGTASSRVSDLRDGATLSEANETDLTPLRLEERWQDFALSSLPALSDFESISMTEGGTSFSFEYTCRPEALERYARASLSPLREAEGTSFSSPSLSGTITIDKESGSLTALSFSLRSEYTAEEGSATLERRFSFAINSFSGIQLEPLYTPAPEN